MTSAPSPAAVRIQMQDAEDAAALVRLTAACGYLPCDKQTDARHWRSPSLVLVDEQIVAQGWQTPEADTPVVLISVHVGAATARIAQDIGADQVVVWPQGKPLLREYLLELLAGPAGHQLLAITGSRGGSGATALATAIACEAARSGRSVVLVDLDPFSFGLLAACGFTATAGLGWGNFQNLKEPVENVPLVTRIPMRAGINVLAGDLHCHSDGGVAAAHAVAACAAQFDVVVADLPRDSPLRTRIQITDAIYISPSGYSGLSSVAALVRTTAATVHTQVVLRTDLGAVSRVAAATSLAPVKPHSLGRLRGLAGADDFGALLSATRQKRLRTLAAAILAQCQPQGNHRAN